MATYTDDDEFPQLHVTKTTLLIEHERSVGPSFLDEWIGQSHGRDPFFAPALTVPALVRSPDQLFFLCPICPHGINVHVASFKDPSAVGSSPVPLVATFRACLQRFHGFYLCRLKSRSRDITRKDRQRVKDLMRRYARFRTFHIDTSVARVVNHHVDIC